MDVIIDGIYLFTDKNIRPDLRLYNPGPLAGVNNNNCDVIIDVRVSDPVCNSHLRGDAIAKAEKEKENKYQSHADVANLCFIPMIFESFGRISKKAKTLVKALVKRIYEQDPEQGLSPGSCTTGTSASQHHFNDHKLK